jgi:hypothetical protein
LNETTMASDNGKMALNLPRTLDFSRFGYDAFSARATLSRP